MKTTGSGFSFIRINPIGSKDQASGLNKHCMRTFKGGYQWVAQQALANGTATDTQVQEQIQSEEDRIQMMTKRASEKGRKELAHIDIRRSHLNEILVGDESVNPLKVALSRVAGREISQDEFDSIRKYDRLKEPDKFKNWTQFDIRRSDGKKIPTNTRILEDVLITYPGAVKLYHMDENGNEIEHPEVSYQDFRDDTIGKSMSRYIDPATGKTVKLYGVPVDKDEFERWKKVSLDFVKDLFGEENVLLATLHMDETMPHIHMTCTPICEIEGGVKTFSHSSFFPDRQSMTQLQTDFANAFEGFGYKRGVEGSGSIHIDPKAIEASIRATVTPQPKDYDTACKRLRSTEEELGRAKAEIKELKRNQEGVIAMRQRADRAYDKHKEESKQMKDRIKELEDKIAEEITRLRAVAQAYYVRNLGLQNLSEQDKELAEATVRNDQALYEIGEKEKKAMGISLPELEALQARGLFLGARSFTRNGLMVDLDFDGHDDRAEADDPLTIEDESRRDHED